MTIGTPLAATQTSSTSSTTPTVPDGAVGDIIIFVVSWYISYSGSSYFTTASKPTLSGAASGRAVPVGAGFVGGPNEAGGVDAGKRGVCAWSVIATDTAGASDALTFSITSGTNNIVAALPVRMSRDTAKDLDIAVTYGEDTNKATTFNPTGFTDIGGAAGDMLLSHIAIIPSSNNSSMTMAFPGCTMGTAGNVATGDITTGHDVRMNTRYRPVTSGTSTGAPTSTGSAVGGGATQLIRIREVDPSATDHTVDVSDSAGLTDEAILTGLPYRDGNLLSERFNAGADGVAITTSNSSISAINAGAPTFIRPSPFEGLGAMKAMQTANESVRWNITNTGTTPLYLSWMYRSSDNPDSFSSHVLLNIVDDAFAVRAQLRQRSDGSLDIRNGTTNVDIGNPISAGVIVRAEWLLDWGAGTQTLSLYIGDNAWGDTPDDVLTGALSNNVRTRVILGSQGAMSAVPGSHHLIDYVDADDTQFVEPASRPSQAHTVTTSDPAGLTDDGQSEHIGYTELPTDTVGLVDTSKQSKGWGHPTTDSAGLVDSSVQACQHDYPGTDSAGLVDAAAFNMALAATPTDPIGLTDSPTVTLEKILTQASSDSTGLTDVATLAAAHRLSVVDSTGLVDGAAVVHSVGHKVTDTDGIGLLDGVKPSEAHNLTPAKDPVGLVDAAALSDIERLNPADGVGLAESSTVVVGNSTTHTEPVGLTDSSSLVGSWNSKPVDGIGLTDDAVVTLIGIDELVDSVGLGDRATVAVVGSTSVTDSTGILDAPTTQLSHVTAVKDNAALSDTAMTGQGHGRSTVDLTGLGDNAVVSRGLGSSPSDGVGLSESSSAPQAHAVRGSDGVGLIDLAAVVSSANIDMSENDVIGLSDLADVRMYLLLPTSATDPAGLTDKIAVSSGHMSVLGDGAGLMDSAKLSLDAVTFVVDTTGMGDLTHVGLETPTSYEDLVGLSDDNVEVYMRGTHVPASDPHAEWGYLNPSTGSITYSGATARIEDPS